MLQIVESLLQLKILTIVIYDCHLFIVQAKGNCMIQLFTSYYISQLNSF